MEENRTWGWGGRVSWSRDLAEIATNSTVVYFGVSALQAYDSGERFYEEICDRGALVPTLIFAGILAGWKLGRRYFDWHEDRIDWE